MNRAAALAFVLVVVLFTLAGAWWLATRGAEAVGESIDRGAPGAQPAEPELLGADDPDTALRVGAPGDDAALAGAVLFGVVETRPGTPADEQLEVALLSRSAPYVSFALRDDAHVHDEERAAEFAEVLIARADVGDDGAFRLAWPADEEELHVIVRGRYHYLSESLAVARANLAEPVRLRPALGAWVVGRVVDSGGAPLDMREHTLEGRPRVGAETADRRLRMRLDVVGDEHGAFELRGLPAVQPYDLWTALPGHAPGAYTLESLRPGERRELELVLPRGGTVRGFVVDGGGRPLAGARVDALVRGRIMGFDDREVRDTTSAANGAFELVATPVGECLVRARLSGYLDSEKATVDVPEGGEVDNVTLMLDVGASLTGKVTWGDGAPAVSARVLVGVEPSVLQGAGALGARRGGKGSSVTDEDGRFRVTGLGSGPFQVSCAVAPEGADADDRAARHRAERAGVKPGDGELLLVLEAPLAIAGHVTDPAGTPITAFHVEAAPTDMGVLEQVISRDDDIDFDDPDNIFGLRRVRGARADVEDEAGAFVLTGLQPGAWSVRAYAEGWVMTEPVPVNVDALAPRPEVALVLQPTAAVSGVVLSPTREPVAGARLRPGTGNVLEELDDRAPAAVSDLDGRFLMTGLDPGSGHLHVVAEGYANTTSEALELPPGAELEGVEIVLSPGGTITGEVYDAGGEAARNETVAATHGALFRTLNTQSDGDGRFRFDNVEPGTWQVIAMNTSAVSDGGEADVADLVGSMRMSSCEVLVGETAHVVLGAPPKDPVRVVGRVTHAGDAVSDVLVSFYPEGANPFERMGLTSVEDDGSFETTVDGSGAYVVSVQRIGSDAGQQQTIEFPCEIPDDVEEFRFDLALPVGRISGRVFGPDGEPAPATRVSIVREGGARSDTLLGGGSNELQTDGEGRYDVSFLRAGTYRLSAGGAPLLDLGTEASGLGRVTRSDIELDEGEWEDDLDLHLPRPGALAIQVRDIAGSGADGASVFVRDAHGRALEALSFRASGAGGKCLYPGLAPGDYTVFARLGGTCAPESAAVTVVEGRTTPVELTLVEGVVLRVQLFDKASGDAARASVSVFDEAEREVSGIFGLQDLQALYASSSFSPTEYRIGPLPPGRYRVRASTPEGLSASKIVKLSAGRGERKLTVRLAD